MEMTSSSSSSGMLEHLCVLRIVNRGLTPTPIAIATQLRTVDAPVLLIWSAPVLTALYYWTNIARREKAQLSLSTPNEQSLLVMLVRPHCKFRCLQLLLRRPGAGQITEFCPKMRPARSDLSRM